MMSAERDFYRKNLWEHAPVFHQPWWLDAVAGDSWDVCLVKEGNIMKSSFLYAFRKDVTGLRIIMPPLTQFLGPHYNLHSTSTREQNNEEIEMLEQLMRQLPSFSSFESRWSFDFQNWLPFHWQHFGQRTRYTYMFDDISDPEQLRKNFSEKINREINKASKIFHIEEVIDVNEFFLLIKKNFEEKKAGISLSKKILQSLFEATRQQHVGKILLAKDGTGKLAAGIFIAWDTTTAYYIIGGKDPASGNSGAMSLLFWHVLNDMKFKVKRFDFEGSMIKGIENYFRSFGAEQRGFFEITKINSPVLQVKSSIKSILKRG